MSDTRLANLIRPGTQGDVVLLGYPYDLGVEINGGRKGAAGGPERFRTCLARFGVARNPQRRIDLSAALAVGDAGDVPAGLSLEESHIELARRTEAILRCGGVPFVVGGGNDQSYPNALALMRCHSPESVGVLNVDAHLDVRPLCEGRAHSGSPFRQLLETPDFSGRNFIEFSAQGDQCDSAHAEFVWTRGGRILWLDEVQLYGNAATVFSASLGELSWKSKVIFVSFDLDSVAGSEAPGVSCPGVLGLSARDAQEIARTAGRHPAVRLFDLSEFNPAVESERTGRLAAAIFYHFCLGVAERKAGRK